MKDTIQKLQKITMSEQQYKSQIQKLQSQLNQANTAKAIETIEPLCKVIGLDASQYVQVTSKMTAGVKSYCDSILKTASAKIKQLERVSTLQILDAQNKRDKAVLAAKEAMEEVAKMGVLG
ncbi:hypothetical protein [Raoultella planticola]|uniref:hypothetical protein n=1 Tax=Raoultella planticola TaxID=575 RepID=UPI00067AA04A|nr:hypothetical protein [Raoultella planticola]MDU4488526.1 hypothetical protein [Klebsiella pneumoniae]